MSPYILLETIGGGAMGTVHKARHRHTGQIVAIKVMTAEAVSNSTLLRRFVQECAVTNRLRHPHLVQGLDLGVMDGRPYLVMEFIDGQSLGARIREQQPLSVKQAIGVGIQIGGALQLAHDHNFIHRDVKPDNILLARDGHAKLTDFGLLKDRSSAVDLTLVGTPLGTIVYAAPEQFEDASDVDPRSDVYGLAASLYYALTGVVPFQGRIATVILRKKLTSSFVPPSHFVSSLPEQVNDSICRALDASPSRRPSSCKELIASLAEALQTTEANSIDDPGARIELRALPTCADDEVDFTSVPDRLAATNPEDRRRAFRFPCVMTAMCSPLRGSQHPWQAIIADISLTGICLTLNRRFEQGAIVTVEIRDQCSRLLLSQCGKVCWVRQLNSRTWSFGARFSRPMNESELDALLGEIPKTAVLELSVPKAE